MPEIDSIYVDEETYTLADIEARKINSLVVTPLEGEPILPQTGDTVNLGFSKVNKYIQNMEETFQDGVDKLAQACIGKGSAPEKPYTPDTVAYAINAIQTAGNYGTLEVKEDGDYYPPQGIDAWNYVKVSKDVGEPHTVVFYGPDGNIIKTQANVPYHGYASCTLLDGTRNGSLYFKGQNPSPTNIVRDTFCYPEYGDYIIEPGEIEDDQETICANHGANYPLGSRKTLVVNSIPVIDIPSEGQSYTNVINLATGAPFINPVKCRGPRENAISCSSFAFQMVKVAEGEDNSTSTQLSSGALNFSQNGWNNQDVPIIAADSFGFSGVYAEPDQGANIIIVYQGQGDSNLRQYLNESFITAFPNCLKNTIQTVNKSYTTFAIAPSSYNGEANPQVVERQSLDKIQIPSLREFHTLIKDLPMDLGTYYEEINGIDYTAVYTPYYNDYAIPTSNGRQVTLRSAGLYNTYYKRQASLRYGVSPSELNAVTVSAVLASPFGFCL